MPIKVNYLKKKINRTSSNLILFTNEKFKTDTLKTYLSSSEFSYINDLLKTSDLKKKITHLRYKFKKKNYFNIF